MDRLTTTIKREHLREIAAGRKKTEYRDIKDYWTRHLSRVGRPFQLRLINGMSKKAPEVTVLISKVRKNTRDDLYELRISKVLSVKNWNRRLEQPA